MPDITQPNRFRAVYEADGAYDRLLLPHFFDGVEDVALVGARLAALYGPPAKELTVAEFGCGTGRVTDVLDPYAAELLVADYSPAMIGAARSRFPSAETMVADTRDAVATLVTQGRTFDLIGAFWSLSYPLGEFFESMSAKGVTPRDVDPADARHAAASFIDSLAELLTPGGLLFAMFFDAETPEQQLVTRLWERVAPFPEGGRRYTLDLLLETLRHRENTGRGTLTHTRRGGVAIAGDKAAAVEWLNMVHLKGMPALISDRDVQQEIIEFVNSHTGEGGRVAFPSGVHIIEYHATDHPLCHLPRAVQ